MTLEQRLKDAAAMIGFANLAPEKMLEITEMTLRAHLDDTKENEPYAKRSISAIEQTLHGLPCDFDEDF